uniref:Uncharacterized protein n=3 Tax=Oryza TaxID=4527 RepID=Q6YWI1_ORYSJ|nr:hypothetical protein [Oryza sativa Japonica Group]BAD22360.1 hypothetical protein [Oryza sativa Japonica Group]
MGDTATLGGEKRRVRRRLRGEAEEEVAHGKDAVKKGGSEEEMGGITCGRVKKLESRGGASPTLDIILAPPLLGREMGKGKVHPSLSPTVLVGGGDGGTQGGGEGGAHVDVVVVIVDDEVGEADKEKGKGGGSGKSSGQCERVWRGRK